MKTKEKLKTYFIGFGIGLILCSLMLYTRWKWHQANPPPPQPAAENAPGGPPEAPRTPP